MGDDSFNPRADQRQTYAVQRTIPRYSVLAVAELVETASTLCIVGKMIEVSRKGCYINTTTTLPVNTVLKVVISRDGQSFVTNGKVIYVHEEIGMGVLFVDSTEEQLEILDSWLAGAARALAP
jgi:hypothetical protein